MKIWKAVLGTALSVTVTIGISSVFAQESPKPEMKCEQRFSELDTDKDGKVTLKEFMEIEHPKGNAEEIFKSRDTDKDEVLTKEEFCSKGMGQEKKK